ncbi:hypothetical protein FNW02_25550 [Komarekiella sp. 'clone 1']|uniref:Uncharacterized protein n=1 Tax=Komarekiella delphini-convector SJRDD-AB1 TaxID=2593771 RepID=A0AA40VTZ7_9NOST|nr:hypothetical protein [Komarekiella delphini-convector]MBD6619096.1 hypothetical protein [Komarekiella delphini-convector SJRDD-AB1]
MNIKLSNTLASGAISFLATTGVVISLQNQVFAQSNNCPATPKIGYRCYEDLKLSARTGYGEPPNTNAKTYSPRDGYRLMKYEEIVHSKFGSGGGLNVDLVRGGSVINIRKVITDENKILLDRKSRAESYAQWSIRVGGETETIEKAIQENNSRLALLEKSSSNVDRVNVSVTVSGRCTRVVLGTCVDNQGGKYEGTIRFQLEYVGTPATISAANNGVIKRIDAALLRFEQEAQAIRQQQQQPQQSPQPQQPTSSSACVSVDSRSGWQHFNLPGSFTKVASISGGWSVDTRNYSSVGSSGHSGADAQALEPYNQYKFDQKFPFGALLMGSGQGTLWIQNAVSFNGSFGAVDMRINDADNALGDNGGSLQVCFGN